MTDQTNDYWKARYQDEHRRAEDNLRLAAERATEIGELQQRIKVLESERNIARNHRDDLQSEVNAVWEKVQHHGSPDHVFQSLPAEVASYLTLLVLRGRPLEQRP